MKGKAVCNRPVPREGGGKRRRKSRYPGAHWREGHEQDFPAYDCPRASGQRREFDGDIEGMAAAAQNDASGRADVGEIAAPGHHDVLLAGQTHVPLHVLLGAKAHANPGSVGQPRDGDPRASYLVIDGPELVFHRVTYDVAALIAKMQELGFPDYLYRRLESGRGV